MNCKSLAESVRRTKKTHSLSLRISRVARHLLRPSVRQLVIVLLDQGLCSVSNFLMNILVARACGVTEYGFYVLGFTLLATARSFQVNLSGTPYTVTQLRLDNDESQSYLGSTLVQQLVISLLLAVVILAGAVATRALSGPNEFAHVLLALVPAAIFVLLRDLVRYVMLAHLLVWPNLLMSLAVNIATIGILLLAYLGGWLNAWVAYLIITVCCALPLIFLLLRQRQELVFARGRFSEHVRLNWSLGKWLVAQTIVYSLAIQIYPWALTFYHGPIAAAQYGACMAIAGVLNPLFAGLSVYLGAKAARAASADISRVHRQVYLSMAILAVPSLACVAGVLLLNEWIMVSAYGDKYAGTGPVLVLCFLSVIITAESMLLNQGINALRRSDIAFWAQLASLAGTAAIGLWLVQEYGLWGAAFGLCISRSLAVIYQLKAFLTLKTSVTR